jgi:hypothetical protein
MAHQYMEQLDESVLAAVIGNVGSLVTFRVGSTDAEILAKEFLPIFNEMDLVNLPKFQIYLKLMIDGVASQPFSAYTLSPIASATGSAEKVIKVSRERYAVNRDKIENKIARWSGMEVGGDVDDDDLDSGANTDAPRAPVPAAKPAAAPALVITNSKVPVNSSPRQNSPQKPAGNSHQSNHQTPKRPLPTNNSNSSHKPPASTSTKPPLKINKNDESLPVNQARPVVIVDTDQTGISLNSLLSAPPAPTKNARPNNEAQKIIIENNNSVSQSPASRLAQPIAPLAPASDVQPTVSPAPVVPIVDSQELTRGSKASPGGLKVIPPDKLEIIDDQI